MTPKDLVIDDVYELTATLNYQWSAGDLFTYKGAINGPMAYYIFEELFGTHTQYYADSMDLRHFKAVPSLNSLPQNNVPNPFGWTSHGAYSEQPKTIPRPICECGADKVGSSRHSAWCPFV